MRHGVCQQIKQTAYGAAEGVIQICVVLGGGSGDTAGMDCWMGEMGCLAPEAAEVVGRLEAAVVTR